jgi:hypothetical protein
LGIPLVVITGNSASGVLDEELRTTRQHVPDIIATLAILAEPISHGAAISGKA